MHLSAGWSYGITGQTIALVYRAYGVASRKQISRKIDTYGFRLIALLRDTPVLLEPLTDERLLKLIGWRQPPTKVEAIVALWHKLGQAPGPLFTEEGDYKCEPFESGFRPDAKFLEALELLLYIRTLPELQVIYRHLSPSGYLRHN